MASNEGDPERIAENLERQRALYGMPLGERIGVLTRALDITQARLAGAIGLSAAMVSQLASGRRCRISDPDVLARLQLLDQRCAELVATPAPSAVAALLAEVSRAQWRWTAPPAMTTHPATTHPARNAPLRSAPAPQPANPSPAVDVLRRLAAPPRLVAAAAVLAPGFPELAELLRRAARG